jgi:acetyl esterase/lipase
MFSGAFPMIRFLTLLLVVGLVPLGFTQEPKKDPPKKAEPKTPAKPAGPPPTFENVPYGKHEREVLDVYQAQSDHPTPVVFAIHGGGWVNGDKSSYRGWAKQVNDGGITLVAINYRYTKQATDAGVEPPVKWPLEDAARALQFVRSKAKEWNLDKERIGATGGSAGGASSLWLAFHDDMANPRSDDPVARESTRLYCAAVNGAQTTLDPKELRAWMPNYRYGGHAFAHGPKKEASFQALLEHRDEVLPWINEYSAIPHVTKDDPPIFMEYPSQKKRPVKGEDQTDPTHSALLGMMLMEKLQSAGVEGILVYPGHPNEKYKTSADFLIDRLPRR